MGVSERKDRQRLEREQRIVSSARKIAESEGWEAVTVRRLAGEIEYSQPVLYSHFENRDAIIAAVAVEGFREITTVIIKAQRKSIDRRSALEYVATAYLGFARTHLALYQAMFTLPTSLKFASGEPHSNLNAAFNALAAAVAPADHDVEVATETFWSALHGLAELERSGRIRQGARSERVALIVKGMLSL